MIQKHVEGDRAEHRVEGQEIPLGDDLGGRLQRVGRHVVHRIAQQVRRVEDDAPEDQEEHHEAEEVLDGVVGMEGDLVLLGDVDADRVVRAEPVQRQNVQEDDGEDHEGQEVVQREEAVERRVADREAAPQPGDDAVADERDGRKEVGDDGGPPEAHLAPGQHVAHEGGGHHQQHDDDADHPQQLARGLVGAVVKPAEHVDVDDDEEEGRAVGVSVAEQPTVVDVPHDVLDAAERHLVVRHIMHREHDTGGDLQHQHDAGERAEIPPVVEISRCRIGDELVIAPADDRQAVVDPAQHAVLENHWLTCLGAHRVLPFGVDRARPIAIMPMPGGATPAASSVSRFSRSNRS